MAVTGANDRFIRDRLYDKTGPGGPLEGTGITVTQMLEHFNKTRGTATADGGAMRRSLRNIAASGYADHDTTRNPPTYKWRHGVQQPYDYQSELASKTTTGKNVMTPALPPTRGGHLGRFPIKDDDDAAKRAHVENIINNRMTKFLEGVKGDPQGKPVTVAASRPQKVPPVIRPNGEQYLPRELAGNADIDTLRKLRTAKLYPLLAGPPGGGKTALTEAAFADETGGLYSLTGDEETRVDDFVGQWFPTGKPDENYWADGPLTLAMKTGGVLFIDDATLINPKAIACVYPAMDGRGMIQIKTHLVEVNGVMQPEIVKAQPGFFVVACHNPGVPGAILSDALASRFRVHIWMESDLELAGELGVNAKFIKVAKNMRTRKKKELGVFVPEMRDLLAARDIANEFGDFAAASNLVGKAPEDFQEDFAREIKTVFGFTVTPGRLEVGGQL